MIALSYSHSVDELREMYANLIANAMIIDNKIEVHPSFVEIIKQLSPLDARIFNEMSSKAANPIAQIKIATEKPRGNFVKLDPPGHLLFSPFALFQSSDDADQTASCLENLKRLNLINLDYTSTYTNDDLYKDIEQHNVIKDFEAEYNKGEKYIFVRKGISSLTTFGRHFESICIKDPTPSA